MLPLFFMQSSNSNHNYNYNNMQPVIESIQKQSWVSPGKRVLVACSGGLDSTFLVNALCQVPDLIVGIAHLNHGLRGDDSDADARFVELLAGKHRLPFYQRKIDLKSNPEIARFGLEAVARKQRYVFFKSVLADQKFDILATAHTATDLIETILLNLMRGTGIPGLRGIVAESEEIVRPLLGYTRQQLEKIVKVIGMPFREDASNQDWRFTRNRIRHGWVNRMNSEDVQSLLSQIQNLQVAANGVSVLVQESCKKLEKQQVKVLKPGKILLDIPQGTGYFSALWKALFDKAFQHVTELETGLTERHFQNLMNLLGEGKTGKITRLPNECVVFRERSRLCFVKDKLDQWSPIKIRPDDSFSGPFFNGFTKIATVPQTLFTSRSVQYLPLLSSGWLLRPWQIGDQMQPFGHSKRVKVSDLLQAARVSPNLKSWWPVLVAGDEIVWIPGVQPGEKIRINNRAQKLVKIELALEAESIE